MKKIIYIDMDGVLCDYKTAYRQSHKANPELKYPQSQEGFFLNLAPLPKAIEAIEFLDAQRIFDVYILTAPSLRNPLCYTEKRLWIEKYLGMGIVRKLIISPNKGLNKGDYLIDDHINGSGQEHFEGQVLHFGYDNFTNWEQVLDFFKQKYELI
ncbi:MAG: hypothetical protein MK212_00875 [Saprospiraceae bacterium]|nr:hypothetical protein [Saprospiraceae bacterium]